MKSAGKARSYGLYRHIRNPKEIIGNLLNDSNNNSSHLLLCMETINIQPKPLEQI